jgi:hypothetical protein
MRANKLCCMKEGSVSVLQESISDDPFTPSSCTGCGKLTSFFELSRLKRKGAPGGWARSRSREGILQLCDVVVQ